MDLEVENDQQSKIKNIMNKKVFDNSLYEDLLKEQQFQIKNPLKKQSKIYNKEYREEEEEEEQPRK